MKKVAIIPLRSGSKSIKGKNKKKLLGRPLFTWVLGEAILSDLDEIYVFTDDNDILSYVDNEYAWTSKVKTLVRSPESATDTASTEYAITEFVKKIDFDFDILCLLQATSPLTTKDDINNCIKKVVNEGYDSSLSVVNLKRFIWDEQGHSLNYDYEKRPRRQDFKGFQVENGAVYVTKKEQYLSNWNRIGGRIGIVEMPEDTFFELDEKNDWIIIESLIISRLNQYKKETKIKYFVFDVDGVFTNGKVDVSEFGEQTKSFSLKDGMGLELLRDSGIQIIVITSENSEIVKKRMEKLGIHNLYLNVKDKYSRLTQIINELDISRSEIAYMGDDINDLSNICSAGWGIAPNDAINAVKSRADLSLKNNGGNESIREAIEFIIKYNERF